MSSDEFTGKSVKEAIARACEELNLDEQLLEVEVLEESTRGFLGIVGQRDARIRVRKRDVPRQVTAAPEIRPGKTEEHEAPPQRHDEAEPPGDEDLPALPVSPTAIDPALVDEARTVLEQILSKIPVEAEVESSIDNGAIYLNIKGDGSGLLIGKKGQTLDALQFLVNKIINKENTLGDRVEIVVDTENYRIRKRENLREMALKTSQKAKKTFKPVSMTPMPPQERRIIHMILAEDREVYTKSYGEGPLRRIIVYPRRGAANKRRRR
ncbi:MAG: RNA-binding cell elongation regulator Jag/EloR [Desulfomonilaceae bacterium]